jgi:hypothetical protein
MDLYNKVSHVKNVILADGVTRAGKFFLAKFLSEFEQVEFLQYNHVLEQLPYMHGIGKIKEDVAVSMLRSTVDYATYDRSLGRNFNMRTLDRSSILNSPSADKFLKRQRFNKSDIEVRKFMHSESRRHLFVTHNVLANVNIFIKAYPNLSVVHIVRNPVELIFSWTKKGYGKLNSADFFSLNSDIDMDGIRLPWYAKNWSSDYKNLTETDMVIKSLRSLYNYINCELKSLSLKERSKIFIIKYEDLVMNTGDTVKKIENFLKTSASDNLDEILYKENCPNKNIMNNHDEKRAAVFKCASEKYANMLSNMEDNYGKNNYFF